MCDVIPALTTEIAGRYPTGITGWLRVEYAVHDDLSACGLTVALAKALLDERISCNVVAGALHDHIFVPVGLADKSLAALKRLQNA